MCVCVLNIFPVENYIVQQIIAISPVERSGVEWADESGVGPEGYSLTLTKNDQFVKQTVLKFIIDTRGPCICQR